MNKIYLFIFAAIMITGFACASSEIQTLGTYRQYQCVNLVQICSNCTYVNITNVMGPNSLTVLGQQQMTKVGTNYNYSFCGTSVLGNYIVNGFGDIDGTTTVWAYDFNISPTEGNENNTTLFLIFIIASAVLLVIAFVFENHVFAFLSGLGFLATGVYTLIYGFGSLTNQYTQMFSMIIIGLGAIVTIVSALEFIQEMSGEGGDTSYDDYDE